MALVTSNSGRSGTGQYTARDSDVSGDNAILAMTSSAEGQVLSVNAVYTTSVTKNVTVTLKSGLGVAHDVLLATIVITAGVSGSYQPAQPLYLGAGDRLLVTSDAGGAGETCALAVYTRVG